MLNNRRRLVELTALRARIDAEIATLEAALEPSRKRGVPRRPPAKCGTDGGYYRHVRTLREPACRECLDAHRDYEARRSGRVAS